MARRASPSDRLAPRRLSLWASILLAAAVALVLFHGFRAGPTLCREADAVQRLCAALADDRP